MRKEEIFSLISIHKNDISDTEYKKLEDAAKRYLNYNAIRRDMRESYKICEVAIEFSKYILNNPNELKSRSLDSWLIRGALRYAVVSYAGWFHSVKGGTNLRDSVNKFFPQGSKNFKCHKKIMEIRDRCLAHPETNILGGDSIYASFDNNGKFVKTTSCYMEQMLIKIDGLDVNSISDCIFSAHNVIDKDILPEKQRNLDSLIQSILQPFMNVKK